MTLFDDDVGRPAAPEAAPADPAANVVRVVPDVPAMDRELDYRVPERLVGRIGIGTVVRVPLHGRRVRGWVVASGVDPGTDRALEDVARVTGLGPDAEVIDLCRWVAWRWVGRLPSVLRMATPDRVVSAVSRRTPTRPSPQRLPAGVHDGLAARLLARGPGVRLLTVGPTADPAEVALAAASLGQALVVVPRVRAAEGVARALARAGGSVARWPGGSALALAGHTVVGGRGAVFAPLPELAAVVVVDEHDEGLQHESSPTWHAREVAVERARRAGVPCLLVSPCPSLDARRAAGFSGVAPAGSRRRGWSPLEVVDRREDDPRTGLYSSAFVDATRRARAAGRSVVCVLNRTGRARLLACRSCGTIAECERCAAAVQSPAESDELVCGRCATVRPTVCLSCGGTAMKLLRVGVTRAREELEALLGEPVGAVSATSEDPQRRGVVIGTEAVLHRAEWVTSDPVGLVAFLDMDQELLATRYRAAEEALALLVGASRLLGGRAAENVVAHRILVQTRQPRHPVLLAALRSDPSVLTAAEEVRRDLLGLPPSGAVAAVGGEGAPDWIERLGRPEGVEVQGPRDGWWLVRAPDPATLADACVAVDRPPGRLRLRVDPVRLP